MAGVSTTAVYDHLQLKEDVVSEYLKDCHAAWMCWFERELETRYKAAEFRLESIADILWKGFEDPKCFGLAFSHIVIKNRPFDSEPFIIARKHKEHLKWLIGRLAAGMGLQDPDMAAVTAILVIERTIALTLITGSPKETETARLLFQCLQHA